MPKKKTLSNIMRELDEMKISLGVELLEKLLPILGTDMTVPEVVNLVELGIGLQKKLGVNNKETFARFLAKVTETNAPKRQIKADDTNANSTNIGAPTMTPSATDN